MPVQDPIIIKKYANRRLYNTASSAYIVAADIVQLVKDDIAFKVVDAKSGEDLTRNILNQVIFEQESQETGFLLPLEFQKQLIQMYSDTYSAMLPDYLSNAMKTFYEQRASMAQAFQQSVQRNNEAMMAFSQRLAEQNQAYFNNSVEMFRAFTGTKKTNEQSEVVQEETSNHTDDKSRDKELQSIKDQVTKLQKQLDEMAKKNDTDEHWIT